MQSDTPQTALVNWRERLLEISALLTLFSLPIGTGPTSLCSVSFLAVWLFGGAWRKEPDWWKKQTPWLLPVALLFALPWISLIWSVNPEPRLYPFLQRTHFWLLALATACLALREIKPQHLALALIVGVELNVLLFLPVKLGLMLPHKTLHAFMTRGYITYSLLLVLATALLSLQFRKSSGMKVRMLLLAVMATNLFCISLLLGRSGHLAFVILAPVIASNLFSGCSRWVVLVATVALIGVLAASPTVQRRASDVSKDIQVYQTGNTREITKTSAGARMMFWTGGLRIFRDNPLIGVGIDGYPVAMKKLYPESDNAFTNPHSFYIYVAASYGILGLSLFAWLWVATLRRAWPHREQWGGFFVLATLVIITIGSLSDITPLSPPTGILLAMMAGFPLDR